MAASSAPICHDHSIGECDVHKKNFLPALSWVIAAFIALSLPADARNLVPLRDNRYDYLCVDFDAIRTEATGWTVYGMTYCSGTHGGQPAPVLSYAVRCAEYRQTGRIDLQLYASRWEPTTVRGLDELAVQLVCNR
jgi:hypothetical protein